MKSNLHEFFKADEALADGGVWFNISDTTGFLVRRMSPTNPRVKKAAARHFKPHAAAINAGTLDPKAEHKILAQVFIEVSLVDWKGVEIDGEIVPYTPERALKLFEELPDLLYTLQAHSEDLKNYREELGNS